MLITIFIHLSKLEKDSQINTEITRDLSKKTVGLDEVAFPQLFY